jgi:hypothetical protein
MKVPFASALNMPNASAAWGYSFSIADHLKCTTRSFGGQRQCCDSGLQPDLGIGVRVQWNERASLIVRAALQLLFDGIHLPVKAIILGMVAVEHGPILVQGNGQEAFDQLVHGHVLKMNLLHG